MKRALLVILGGLIATIVLVSAGTEVVMILTGWRAVVTQTPKNFDSFLEFMRNVLNALLAFVYVPTALLVGYLVGMFSPTRKIICAIIATCPAWLLTAAAAPVIGLVITSAAVLGAWLSERVRISRAADFVK